MAFLDKIGCPVSRNDSSNPPIPIKAPPMPTNIKPQFVIPPTGPDSGHNVDGSEMGHLYYVELGNSADLFSPFDPEIGDFENLDSRNYWSDWAGLVQGFDTYYYFHMGSGCQGTHWDSSAIASGLAVRSGEVSVVPVPGAIWLLGSGLIGLLGIRRKKS